MIKFKLIAILKSLICIHNHIYKSKDILKSMLTIFSKEKANNHKAQMSHGLKAKNILFLSIYLLNKSSAFKFFASK